CEAERNAQERVHKAADSAERRNSVGMAWWSENYCTCQENVPNIEKYMCLGEFATLYKGRINIGIGIGIGIGILLILQASVASLCLHLSRLHVQDFLNNNDPVLDLDHESPLDWKKLGVEHSKAKQLVLRAYPDVFYGEEGGFRTAVVGASAGGAEGTPRIGVYASAPARH
ncbi:hypothetical protein P691DRAFT_786628, partial [Macrolepiota fuliginosa MF-IS2]